MGYKIKDRTSKCLECGDRIEYGRLDRKFCCDACKNRFNNKKAKNSRIVKMRILHVLNKNYSILDRLIKINVTALTVMQLKQMGFDFDYITSYRKFRRHDEYGCFDISLVIMSSKVISITKMPSFLHLSDECQKND